jgi:hypothetical protein
MEKKKVFIIVGILGAIGAVAYFVFSPKGKVLMGKAFNPVSSVNADTKTKTVVTQTETTNPDDDIHSVSTNVGAEAGFSLGSLFNTVSTKNVDTSYPGCPGYKAESFPLKKGMKGKKIAALQADINKVYLSVLPAKLTMDGCFGAKTEAAVLKITTKTSVSEQDYAKIAMAAQGVPNFVL